jgi:hypothetical protein
MLPQLQVAVSPRRLPSLSGVEACAGDSIPPPHRLSCFSPHICCTQAAELHVCGRQRLGSTPCLPRMPSSWHDSKCSSDAPLECHANVGGCPGCWSTCFNYFDDLRKQAVASRVSCQRRRRPRTLEPLAWQDLPGAFPDRGRASKALPHREREGLGSRQLEDRETHRSSSAATSWSLPSLPAAKGGVGTPRQQRAAQLLPRPPPPAAEDTGAAPRCAALLPTGHRRSWSPPPPQRSNILLEWAWPTEQPGNAGRASSSLPCAPRASVGGVGRQGRHAMAWDGEPGIPGHVPKRGRQEDLGTCVETEDGRGASRGPPESHGPVLQWANSSGCGELPFRQRRSLAPWVAASGRAVSKKRTAANICEQDFEAIEKPSVLVANGGPEREMHAGSAIAGSHQAKGRAVADCAYMPLPLKRTAHDVEAFEDGSKRVVRACTRRAQVRKGFVKIDVYWPFGSNDEPPLHKRSKKVVSVDTTPLVLEVLGCELDADASFALKLACSDMLAVAGGMPLDSLFFGKSSKGELQNAIRTLSRRQSIN